jgi:hypothetical protein
LQRFRTDPILASMVRSLLQGRPSLFVGRVDRRETRERAGNPDRAPLRGSAARRLRRTRGGVGGFVRHGQPAPLRGGWAHGRHGQARLPAMVQGGSTTLLGVRGRDRQRGREAHEPPDKVGGRTFQQILRPWREGLRLRHQRDHHNPGARGGRGLLGRLLRQRPGCARNERLPRSGPRAWTSSTRP